MPNLTLRTEFGNAYAQRSAVEARFRECAAMTQPTVLPALGQAAESEILRPYQNLGTDGVRNLVNKLLIALFTPGQPWFRHKALPIIWRDDEAGVDAAAAAEQFLYAYDLLIYQRFYAMKHLAKMRTSIEQLIVIGNSLSKITDDYKLKQFRFDQYVWKRGSDAELLWLITKECVDPRQLTDEQIVRAGIRSQELDDAAQHNKTFDIYTKAARERTGHWLVRQQIKDKPVAWSVEPVNPYLTAGYVEVPGENYSRGRVEESLGDLRSFNGLSKAILDMAVAAAMVHPVIDDGKGWDAKDLLKPNGEIIVGRVEGREANGIAFLHPDMGPDSQVPMLHAETIARRLNKQFLMESALQPQEERVTATQIMRIARELEGALGNVYAELAEEMQRPLLDRLVYQMKRDNLLPVFPVQIEKAVTVQLLTGVEALGRSWDYERALNALQTIGQMPDLMARLKPDWILNTILRGLGIDTQAAIKTPEEIAEEQQAAIDAQTQAMAAQTALQTGGAVVEQAAKAGMAA